MTDASDVGSNGRERHRFSEDAFSPIFGTAIEAKDMLLHRLRPWKAGFQEILDFLSYSLAGGLLFGISHNLFADGFDVGLDQFARSSLQSFGGRNRCSNPHRPRWGREA